MAKPTFSTAHLDLGPAFSDPVRAADFPATTLRYRNNAAAHSVGLDTLTDDQWVAHFGRFKPFDGAQPEPLALRYHGHQFMHYNPDLGDGRGFLFAQLYEQSTQGRHSNSRLLDLGTKGSGTTPYSRAGDGRLTLKGAVREALATATLDAMGVNTSRTLSVIETGEDLYRGDEPSPTRSAVMVRLNHSHIRFGTFQRLSFEGDIQSLETLVHHCLTHYYRDVEGGNTAESRAKALLSAVCSAKAKTVAQWMAAGFVHGVLNTDNMNITGESFDYGPYRFLPHYDPGFTAAYFDNQGLYAYGRQPQAVMWNLQQLAGTLSHFTSAENLVEILRSYGTQLEQEIASAMFARFGMQTPDLDTANSLLTAFFDRMRTTQIAFQAPFHDIYGGGSQRLGDALAGPRSAEYNQAGLGEVMAKIADLNPLNTRTLPPSLDDAPLDLGYQDIERIWQRIDQDDDWSAFHERLALLEHAIAKS